MVLERVPMRWGHGAVGIRELGDLPEGALGHSSGFFSGQMNIGYDALQIKRCLRNVRQELVPTYAAREDAFNDLLVTGVRFSR